MPSAAVCREGPGCGDLQAAPQLDRYTVPVMAHSVGPVGGNELQPQLIVPLDREASLPLHEQIEHSLREQIRSGRLLAGTRLPSTRGLAAELGVSRGVVSEAYGQLAAEGYLAISQGAPVRVTAAVMVGTAPPPARSLIPSYAYDLRPGLPDLAAFPAEPWLRCLRTALRQAPLSALGNPDPRGVPALREALASYLGRTRGVAAEPEHILICTGFTQGFSLTCRALAAAGVESVALEDPGWHTHRVIVEQAGMSVVAVPVDEEGLVIEALAATDATVVLVTPSHQFPTGAMMSPARRAQLIEWVEREDGLIVEDDYDGELRHDRAAVGALQGLAPERVLYAGSASKRLAPALRIGWLLPPSWLAWQMIAAKSIEDNGSEALGQLALACMIARGHLDRHLRRMRLTYAHRRGALLDALSEMLPQLQALGAPSGIFELVSLPDGTEESTLLRTAAALGVGAEGLALHRFSAAGRPGLLLGYGHLAEPGLRRAVGLLAQAIAELD